MASGGMLRRLQPFIVKYGRSDQVPPYADQKDACALGSSHSRYLTLFATIGFMNDNTQRSWDWLASTPTHEEVE